MPDITDTVSGFLLNGYFKQWYGHALIGIFTLDLLGGLFITWIIAFTARRFFNPRHVRRVWQASLAKAPQNGDPAAARGTTLRWPVRFRLWSFSVLVGILSHIFFDLISHDTNLLLYPWYEHPRWFPGWWYATWFEIRPWPMFGHSYSVGIFTLIWGLLTVLGIFLFFRFLASIREKRG